jgi:hypothetical protein
MLKVSASEWELLDDLTHLSDWELLQLLGSAKHAAHEVEAAVDDERRQTVIDALLQWEVVNDLEHERTSRCLQEVEINFPPLHGFRLSSIEGQYHTGELLWTDAQPNQCIAIVRAKAEGLTYTTRVLPNNPCAAACLHQLVQTLDHLHCAVETPLPTSGAP